MTIILFIYHFKLFIIFIIQFHHNFLINDLIMHISYHLYCLYYLYCYFYHLDDFIYIFLILTIINYFLNLYHLYIFRIII